MKFKWVITTVIAMLLLVAFWGLAGHDSIVAAQDVSGKIEGLLLDNFTAEGSADFIVRFNEQADLSAAYSMDWNARGEFVYNTLRDAADRSQVNAKAILDGRGLKYQTMIAGNDLYVWNGTQVVAEELAVLPEVYFIRATRTYYITPIETASISWSGDLVATHAVTTVGSSTMATTDWGITDTKADQFWTAFGVKGDGIKVANIDTGVYWNHPALINQFACPGDPSNPDCWADPSNICGGSACDNNNHGTHTMGTMVAKDDQSLQYIAGMAPNSTWIACKGCESSSCSSFALETCADWILAPGGDPANRPDVVNNSWGGGSGDPWYLAKVNAWRAAGVFPAFAAGNAGPYCGSISSPGDYQESFAAAAHDVSRTIASFSGRGPSAFGHDPYTKPNVSAPGVNVCSTVPGGGFACAGWSGTSMASPHVAGAVALLWSCNPALVGQIEVTFQILQDNADTPPAGDCGAPPDGQGNYTFGYGYLDALQAGIGSCGGVVLGTLEGHVYDTDGLPIEGASVNASPGIEGNQVQALTDPNGFYTMNLVPGTYNVTASKIGYTTVTEPGVVILENTTTVQNFTLEFLGLWTQIPLPAGCPEYTRLDAEYFPGTGLAYILGGRGGASGGDTFGDIWSFNPVSKTCTDTGANMPTPISNYTVLALNDGSADLLCTFGGRDSAGLMVNVVQCYNPATNAVSTKAPLPSAFTTFLPGGMAVVNNKAYIFGGFRNTASPYHTNVTYEYDPVADSYTAKGNLTLGRGYIDVAVVDGLIYAFGGDVYDGANLNAQTKAELFDPATGNWSDPAVADLPTSTGEGRAFGFDTNSTYELAGMIVVTGGGQWPGDTNEVFSYDVANDVYDYTFPNLNTTRRNQAGFFVPGDPGFMWVYGGRSGSDLPPYATPEYYQVNLLVQEPDIVVEPAFLYEEQLPGITTTVPITISNVGNLPLTWDVADDVAWLTEAPTAGEVPPGELTNVMVTFDSTGLAVGVYTGTLSVNSNDPDEPLVQLPVTLKVLPQADLAITKTDSPDPVRLGNNLTYTLMVTNNGPQDATGVVVTDTLPAGVTFVSASEGCTEGIDGVVCDVGALAMGGVKEITIVVKTDVEGTITNTAIVTGVEHDPVGGNNTATQDTVVVEIFDIYLPLMQKQ